MKNTIYNKIGTGYNRHRTADKRIVNTIKCLLNLPIESNIADIGAGSGNYSNALAHLGFKVKAVEPSIEIRNCMSGFALSNQTIVKSGIQRLEKKFRIRGM